MNRTRLLYCIALALASGSSMAAEAAAVIPAITPAIGFSQITLALLLVLALLFGGTWLLKRMGPIAQANKINLKVVAGISVGNRERVMVVEVGDQWLILGVTANQISHLGNLPKQEGVSADATLVGGPFQAWLSRTIEQRKQARDDSKPGSAV